jgi:thioredoxin-dependent peroxiredoxin
MAKAPQLALKEGDPAPDFTARTSGGKEVSLKDFAGRYVVLYFYPKDDTPGCTKEACGFRDQFAAFRKKKIEVLGVSTDSVKAHDKFVAKYNLPFTLLSDEDRRIVQAYGVWGEKSFMGRRYQGTFRVTFLIGPNGRIQKIWPEVKAATHAEEVLASLR